MRRVGSCRSLTAGARSSHSQSRAHLRKIARIRASVRFTVPLLHPSARFASVIASINARLILSSSRLARKRSSQRSFSLSSSSEALWDCSRSQRTAASCQTRLGLHPSFCNRQTSLFSLSCSSCAWALLPVSVDRRTRSPLGVAMSIHQIDPRFRSDIQPPVRSLAALAVSQDTASARTRRGRSPGKSSADPSLPPGIRPRLARVRTSSGCM